MVIISRFIELEDGESANGVIAGKTIKLPYTCIEKVSKNAKRIIYDAESKEAVKLIIENNLIDKNCYPLIERFRGTSYTSIHGVREEDKACDIGMKFVESKALAVIVNAYVFGTGACLASGASAKLNKNNMLNGLDILTSCNCEKPMLFKYNLMCDAITLEAVKKLSKILYENGYIITQINRFCILAMCRPNNNKFRKLTKVAKLIYKELNVIGSMEVTIDGDIVGCIHE